MSCFPEANGDVPWTELLLPKSPNYTSQSHVVGTEHRDTELASGVELRAVRMTRLSEGEEQKEGKQVLSMNSAQISGRFVSSADSPSPQRTYIFGNNN